MLLDSRETRVLDWQGKFICFYQATAKNITKFECQIKIDMAVDC